MKRVTQTETDPENPLTADVLDANQWISDTKSEQEEVLFQYCKHPHIMHIHQSLHTLSSSSV